MPLEMTSKAKNSRFFGSLPPHLYNTLSKTPCAEHMHNYCITPESFKGTSSSSPRASPSSSSSSSSSDLVWCLDDETEKRGLGDMFEILATNKDAEGKVFVSCIEGKRYPFWAGQFHPERNGWEWSDEEDIDHSLDAVVSMHHLAAFLVRESGRNRHRFEDKGEEEARLICNPPARLVPTLQESRMYQQTFLWSYQDDDEAPLNREGSTEEDDRETSLTASA